MKLKLPNGRELKARGNKNTPIQFGGSFGSYGSYNLSLSHDKFNLTNDKSQGGGVYEGQAKPVATIATIATTDPYRENEVENVERKKVESEIIESGRVESERVEKERAESGRAEKENNEYLLKDRLA